MAKGPNPLAVNVHPPLEHLREDPLWRATFRGFFWGEGWLGINRFQQRRNGKVNWQYRPEVMITQNHDNKVIIFHIRDVMGGYVYERAPYRHGSDSKVRGPYFTWQARSQGVVARALEILQDETFFIDKKVEKLEAMAEFMQILTDHGGKRKGPEVIERIEQLREVATPSGVKLAG